MSDSQQPGQAGLGKYLPESILQSLSEMKVAFGLTVTILLMLIFFGTMGLYCAVALASAFLIYFDASSNKIGEIPKEQLPESTMSAGLWAILTIVLWFFIFPTYLVERPKLIKNALAHPQDASNVNRKLGILTVAAAWFFLAWVGGTKTDEKSVAQSPSAVSEETKAPEKSVGTSPSAAAQDEALKDSPAPSSSAPTSAASTSPQMSSMADGKVDADVLCGQLQGVEWITPEGGIDPEGTPFDGMSGRVSAGTYEVRIPGHTLPESNRYVASSKQKINIIVSRQEADNSVYLVVVSGDLDLNDTTAAGDILQGMRDIICNCCVPGSDAKEFFQRKDFTFKAAGKGATTAVGKATVGAKLKNKNGKMEMTFYVGQSSPKADSSKSGASKSPAYKEGYETGRTMAERGTSAYAENGKPDFICTQIEDEYDRLRTDYENVRATVGDGDEDCQGVKGIADGFRDEVNRHGFGVM